MICQTCTPVLVPNVPAQLNALLRSITTEEKTAFHSVCCQGSRDPALICIMNKAVGNLRRHLAGFDGEMRQWIHRYKLQDNMPKIDIAIALEGPLVQALLPLTLWTMRNLNLMDGVNLHFVHRGLAPAVLDYASTYGQIHEMPDPECVTYAKAPERPDCPSACKDVVADVCATMEWMVEHCGNREWVFIMHFDLEFIGPWIDYYRSLIDSTVGQIGDHAGGLVGYNRRMLNLMDVSFWHMSSIYIVRNHYGDLKARHASDARCTNKEIPVHGFDVGELLELYMQHYGWNVLVETDVAQQRFRIHNGSGGGRCGDVVNRMILERTLKTLARYNLAPI